MPKEAKKFQVIDGEIHFVLGSVINAPGKESYGSMMYDLFRYICTLYMYQRSKSGIFHGHRSPHKHINTHKDALYIKYLDRESEISVFH